MTTYTTITNSEIDQDSPITQPLLTSLRDNPIAIAEGSSGAPRIQGKALQTWVDRITGGTDSITGLDDYGALNLRGRAEFLTSSSSTIQIQLSDNNGSTWASATTVATIITVSNTDKHFAGADLSINLLTGDYSLVATQLDWFDDGLVTNLILSGFTSNGTITMPAGDVNAVRVVASSGSNYDFNVYGG